jgi:hypothetical protein
MTKVKPKKGATEVTWVTTPPAVPFGKVTSGLPWAVRRDVRETM